MLIAVNCRSGYLKLTQWGVFDVLGGYMLFLVLWIAMGISGLFIGVVVIGKSARQMERAAAESSRATKSEDALVA
jgi:hypothetical protein